MKKKIPFDIKYKPQLQAQKYEAVTEGNLPVEILKWDAGGSFPIVAIIKLGDGSVEPRLFDENGRRSGNLSDDFLSLYLLVDRDPEFTELEEKLIEFRNKTPLISVDFRENKGKAIIKQYAKEILSLASKEIMPKRRKCPEDENHGAGITQIRGLWSILWGGYYITLEDFDKLPKEE